MTIARTAGPTQIGTGTTAIDASGADFIVVECADYTTGFSPKTPTAITYDGNTMTLLAASSGDPGAGHRIYGYPVGGIGSADLVVTYSGGSGLGPKVTYMLFSGVVQSTIANDVRRTPTFDNTEGTSISLSPTCETDDHLLFFGMDYGGDNTHTPSGVNTELLETTITSFLSFCVGEFVATGSSHTGGWTSGTEMTGIAFALIPAAAAVAGPAALARRRSSLICR